MLTDGCDEAIKVAVWEKWLSKLSEKQLERSGEDVDVFPLSVLQVQFLCLNTTGAQIINDQQRAPLSTLRSCTAAVWHMRTFKVKEFYRDLL